MPDLLNNILGSVRTLWGGIEQFLPQLLVAFVLLTVGWIVAKLLRKGVAKGLKLLRVDIAAEKAGVDDFLLRGGVKSTVVTIIADLVYWLLMFAFVITLLNILGMRAADELFNRIVQYIPNIVVALLVLIFGTLFARFMRGVTTAYLSNIGIAGAEFVGQIAQWALIVFIVSVALEQLSIGGQIVVSAFQIGFGALCFGFALAFGLGGKDWAARVLEKLWNSKR
jgi:hypothetical protein